MQKTICADRSCTNLKHAHSWQRKELCNCGKNPGFHDPELDIKDRLEYLRSQIEAECISYGEIAELQSLVEYIEPGDNLLLEWAGVPENQEFNKTHTKKEILESRQAVIDSNESEE